MNAVFFFPLPGDCELYQLKKNKIKALSQIRFGTNFILYCDGLLISIIFCHVKICSLLCTKLICYPQLESPCSRRKNRGGAGREGGGEERAGVENSAQSHQRLGPASGQLLELKLSHLYGSQISVCKGCVSVT